MSFNANPNPTANAAPIPTAIDHENAATRIGMISVPTPR